MSIVGAAAEQGMGPTKRTDVGGGGKVLTRQKFLKDVET